MFPGHTKVIQGECVRGISEVRSTIQLLLWGFNHRGRRLKVMARWILGGNKGESGGF